MREGIDDAFYKFAVILGISVIILKVVVSVLNILI
jgi:hypothetical protein